MTNEEILEAAKEATNNQPIYGRKEFTFSADELERFAAIIEKRTIERCAAALDKVMVTDHSMNSFKRCKAAIRKLGDE